LRERKAEGKSKIIDAWTIGVELLVGEVSVGEVGRGAREDDVVVEDEKQCTFSMARDKNPNGITVACSIPRIRQR
jgi:hypothetical protein